MSVRFFFTTFYHDMMKITNRKMTYFEVKFSITKKLKLPVSSVCFVTVT